MGADVGRDADDDQVEDNGERSKDHFSEPSALGGDVRGSSIVALLLRQLLRLLRHHDRLRMLLLLLLLKLRLRQRVRLVVMINSLGLRGMLLRIHFVLPFSFAALRALDTPLLSFATPRISL